MVNKLRLCLTVFNTSITSLILIGMTVLCLILSEKNTKDQTYRNFLDTVNHATSYVETQSQISDGWLRAIERNGQCRISIWDAGRPLFSQSLSEERSVWELDFEKARSYAKENYGIEYRADEKCKESSHLEFTLQGIGGTAYYANLSLLTKDEGIIELILLYSLEEMEATIGNQRTMVSLAALLGIGLLTLFSWGFTGKMLQPIQENQRRQTEFIAAASHELRTPLAAILSATSAMERAEPAQRAQFSHMVHREGERMSRLIGDMLTLASSDSKNWELNRRNTELDMLVLDAYETHYQLMKEKGLTLELSLYEQDFPVMQLDPDQISQVLSILLDNARNMTPPQGKVELELIRYRSTVQIRVSDTGPGVPDGEKQKIFDRFYRKDLSRSTRNHFGLGLSIASEIVKRHHGRIWVQDAQSGGAEFIVELPLP